QEDGHVVRLEPRRVRVAREAARRQQHRLARAPVEREVCACRGRDTLVEVGQPPRDRHTEACRVRRVLGVEARKRLLELVLRAAKVVRLDRGRDDLAVQRRHEHLDAFARDRAEVEHVLLGPPRPMCLRGRGRVRGAAWALRELVDELVDAGTAERGGRRAAEEPTPREPHQPSGRTSTSPASSRSRLCTTCAYVYGWITCSLTVYSEPA